MKYKSIYLILFIALIIPFSSVFLLININLNEQNNVNRISVEPILSDVIVGNYTVPGISGPISLNQVLKIGILDDMNHISGEDAWKGALLAAREINEVGGVLINGTTYYIGLVVEDTRETSFDFDTALNAVDKMITIHKPHYIIGGYQEEVAYNYVENIMENKTPFVSTGLISDWWCERVLTDYSTYKYFFRITPLNSTSLANELVSYILYLFDYLNSTYGASTLNIGLLYENLIWTNDIRDSLLNLPILNPNITIVNQISFPPTMIDPPSMSTWLTNLESSGAQIVIPLISLGAGIIMSDQYEALKPGYLLAGINDYSQSDRYWDQTSGTCRYEILMQNIYNSSKTTLTMPFWNNFTGEYNNEPYYTGAGSYDAVRLLANVSFKAQSFNSDTIVAQLENINTSNPFPGVAGNIAFTPFHDLVEGWPFTTSLFTQWQMDGNKVVLPSGGSIYPDSLATGTLSIPYWGINNIVADYSHLLPGDFNLASDADDPDTNGAFNLIWTDSDGADNYSLYMSNETITYVSEKHTALAIQTAISPFLISGLRTGEYYFVIVAYNETGQKFSNNVHITVQLPAPGNFTLSSDADDPDTNGAFNLIWTDSDGADNYSVYTYNQLITEINGSLTNIAYQTAISPFPISGLSNGDYYYVVVAYNQTGQTMSNCIKITVQHPPPGNFDLSSDADDPDTNGAFNLIWTDSDGADNYSVYTHNQFITKINGSLTNLSYQTAISPFPISGLLNGDYYYVVVAYNQTGQTMSNCINVTVQHSPPGDFDLSSNAGDPDTNGAFNLIWTDSDGADNYSVYTHNQFITKINGSLTNLAYQTAVSPFPISGLSNGDYYYVVVAYNRAGQTMSNCIKITVQHLPPGDFDLSSDAGDPDKNGIFYLSWTDSDGADNYSVYTHNQFITEINGSLTNLAYQTAVSPFPISGLSNGDYYYVVVAYNQTGQTMSNCIQVTVFLSGEDGTTVIVIPGYNVIFLLSIFSFVSLIIIKKRHKSFK